MTVLGIEPYGEGEWMRDQIHRVRLLLARHRLAYAERDLHPDPRSRHMFVSDAEADALLTGTTTETRGETEAINAELAALDEAIGRRVELTIGEGGSVPSEDLRAAFHLDQAGLDVVTLLAVIEFDPQIARLCTNAWCDFTRKQADVAFILEVLATTWSDRLALRELLLPTSPLAQFRLLTLRSSDKWGADTPALYQLVRLSDRVVDFLVTGDRTRLDVHVATYATMHLGDRHTLDELFIPSVLKDSLVTFLRIQARDRNSPPRLLLLGPSGCGKKTLIIGIAALIGRAVLAIDTRRLSTDPTVLGEQLRLGMREARLAGAELYVDAHGDFCTGEGTELQRRVFLDLQRWYPESLFVGSEHEPSWLRETGKMASLTIPFPTAEVQEALWRRLLAGRASLEDGFSLDELVASYALSGGAIERAADEAIYQSRLRSDGRKLVIKREIALGAAQIQLSHRLGLLAEKVTRMLSWTDLVLPDKTLQALKELIDQYRHQNMVFNEWGFSTKVSYGRGLSALFHGPPGTGKTMVAGIIARELGLELYMIDLSRVVDKYIGETEKNLGRIFDEAARSNAILLFDEADSLFSKRTSVKSSHDRYANLETNYLLQRIEQFDGVCLLTTNFEASIDDAFKRRLRFKITFPFPKEAERARLWATMLPERAAVSGEIRFEELGFLFEMTGGHIKNAVLRCAFMAARAGTPITHDLMVDAATEEYREMGKLIRT